MKFLPLLLLSSLIQIPVVALNQKPSIGIVQQTNVAKKAQVDKLNAEGEKLFNKGEYSAALAKFKQGLVLIKRIGYKQAESISIDLIGELDRARGKYLEAIKFDRQSLAISQKIGYKIGESNTLNNMARVYRSLGQYPKALEYYERSLKISEKIENKQGESTTLNNMGRVYSSLGQYQKALASYKRSLEISEKIEYKQGSGATLNNMGEIHSSLKEYEKALEYYERSLKISQIIRYPAGERSTLNNMGRVYQLQRQYQKALEYYQPALDIGKKIDYKAGIGSTLNNMGEVYSSLGQYEKALKYYQESLDITKKIRYPYIEATTLTNIGDALLAQNKPALAEQPLREAISIWENIRSNKDNSGKGLGDSDKLAFADRIPATYKLLQKVLIQQNKPQAALEISERGRARALAELLASRSIDVATNTLEAPKAPNLAQIQQVAQNQNATLVEYSLIDETIYIWVISPNGQITFGQSKLPPNTNIKDLVNTSRNNIGVGDPELSKNGVAPSSAAAQGDLKLLHKLLIVPISKSLPKDPNQRVIIIPQGELFFVPFVALKDSRDKYLIEQHTISTASSIGLLDNTPKPAKFNLKQGTALVVGNPKMPLDPTDYTQLDALEGAEREAIAVSRILKTTPLIGEQADKNVVIDKMRSASIVHFATHGLLAKVEGDIPGAIALTNSFLTSNEIFDLKLKSDLVVLSACDTGRGDLSGDGVIGLSRALAVAGVPSVAVSLWKVTDDPTKELMVEFYQNWYDQRMGKAQAMRQAMLKVMKTHEEPMHWAAFTIMGEAR